MFGVSENWAHWDDRSKAAVGAGGGSNNGLRSSYARVLVSSALPRDEGDQIKGYLWNDALRGLRKRGKDTPYVDFVSSVLGRDVIRGR